MTGVEFRVGSSTVVKSPEILGRVPVHLTVHSGSVPREHSQCRAAFRFGRNLTRSVAGADVSRQIGVSSY
jgi:hypothetical protein